MTRRLSKQAARAAGVALAVFALVLLPMERAVAQQATVTGQVVDAATLEPLVGAQVTIVGTNIGTLTNDEGRYRITGLDAGPAEVRVQLIGYSDSQRSVTLEAGETAVVSFELSAAAVSLDEVVVTATGQQQARELGTAISTMDAAEITEKTAPASLTDLLQGRTTGVSILRSSGSVGTASSLKIRGVTSLGLDNTPIVYVDGARIANNNAIAAGAGGQDYSLLNTLNPRNIARIQVIKGPAAAALYGTEASAGVILITTKRGSVQETRYRFQVQRGWNWDPTEWWSVAWNPTGGLSVALFTGGNVVSTKDTVYTLSLLEGAGRFESPFRTGVMQTYSASVSGGSGTATYFVSGQYADREGNLPTNRVERYNLRGNFTLRPSDELMLRVSNGFASGFTRLPPNDNSLFGIIGNALGAPWNGPLTRPDPTTGGEAIQTCFLAYEVARASGRPLDEVTTNFCGSPYFIASNEELFTRINRRDVERYTGSAALTYRPTEFWTNRFSIGYDQHTARLENIVPVDPARPFGVASEGFISIGSRIGRILTIDATSSLNFDLTDDLESTTTVGGQYVSERLRGTSAVGRRFPAGSPSVDASVENEGDDFYFAAKTAGVFLAEQLGWKDRLYLKPAIRFDDNSAFGENLSGTFYPKLSASYVMSEAAYFPEFFDQFRVRAAWGQAGRQPGPTDALALLTPVPVSLRSESVLGVRRLQPGNPDLKPETAEEFEVGFDASMLRDRLSLQFTYYDKTTHNAIVASQLAPSSGFPDEIFRNVSEISNSGFEIVLDATLMQRENVYWNWHVNVSTNQNEITDLATPIIFGTQRHVEGFPAGAYFARPISINDEGVAVVGDTVVFMGEPFPDWFGSVSTTLGLFDGLQIYALVDFAGGHQLLNGFQAFSCGLFGGGGLFGACPQIFQTTPNGEFTEEALIKQAAAATGTDAPWVSDADFAKLRTVTVSYQLPAGWAGAVGARGLRLSVTGNNLATWTPYPGTNPEVNFAGGAAFVRSQLWTLPPTREIITSLSVTF